MSRDSAAAKSLETSAAHCRACGRRGLELILSLGTTPLADRLVAPDRLEQEDATAPLDLAFCPSCALVQITHTVPPEILFAADYPCFSSVSPALLAHARAHAQSLIEARRLGRDSLVVEVASNDGYLLRNFLGRNVPAIGVDPAAGPAAAARRALVAGTTYRSSIGKTACPPTVRCC